MKTYDSDIVDATHEVTHTLQGLELHSLQNTVCSVYPLLATHTAKQRSSDQVYKSPRMVVVVVQLREQAIQMLLEIVRCNDVVCTESVR